MILQVEETYMSTIAIREMRNDEIWQKYYNDFIHHYLHLSAAPNSLEHKLLQLEFTNILRDCNEMKAIAAHCYLHLFQLDLAKTVASLEPFCQLQVLKEYSAVSTLQTSESALDMTGISKSVNDTLFSVYVDTLFAVLVNTIKNEDKHYRLNSLGKWFNAYRDMVG